MLPKSTKTPLKIAILHSFFKGDCKGGGEKLVLELREKLKADLWVGGIDLEAWNPKNKDWFSKKAFDKRFKLFYLHTESTIPFWKQLKRQLFFAFSPKIEDLGDYDVIIFSGNIGFVPRRLANSKAKKIMYCHTPPRPFTDQFQTRLNEVPIFLRFAVIWFKNWLLGQYQQDTAKMDIVVANSQNIANRLKEYCNIKANTVIWPPINTDRFKFLEQKEYFLSFARLEKLKRIPLLVEAFAKMPDKKLVICSSGPLKGWLEQELVEKKYKNIEYKGLVSDTELEKLVGNCLAGIYIPENEDAGITQCEIMSAGKPVIGSKEGGLTETIIDGKTGILIDTLSNKKYLSDDKIVKNLIQGVQAMTPKKALLMKENCQKQAKKFDKAIFFEKMEKLIYSF